MLRLVASPGLIPGTRIKPALRDRKSILFIDSISWDYSIAAEKALDLRRVKPLLVVPAGGGKQGRWTSINWKLF
jgi:hypothetical protein